MSQYSISDLEKLCGVKSHTIRMWERRYDLRYLDTQRTETNIRYYSDEDLKYMLNLSLLVNNGIKISKAARMSKEEINATVNKLTLAVDSHEFEINTLLVCMSEFDEARFDRQVTSCMMKYGVEQTVINIIYPFLSKIGILWQTGAINPAQEHFVSNLIRQKLNVAVDGLVIPDVRLTKKYLLFLPEGELHEIGLLFANYLVRARGFHTLYLGQSVPMENLLETNKFYNADYLFTIFTSAFRGEELTEYLKLLSKTFSKTEILVSGLPLEDKEITKIPSNITVLKRVEDTMEHLKKEKGN